GLAPAERIATSERLRCVVLSQAIVLEERAELAAEAITIFQIEDQSGVADDFGNCRSRRGLDRQAALHRFDERQAEALVPRREGENRRPAHQRRKVGGGRLPDESYPRINEGG